MSTVTDLASPALELASPALTAEPELPPPSVTWAPPRNSQQGFDRLRAWDYRFVASSEEATYAAVALDASWLLQMLALAAMALSRAASLTRLFVLGVAATSLVLLDILQLCQLSAWAVTVTLLRRHAAPAAAAPLPHGESGGASDEVVPSAGTVSAGGRSTPSFVGGASLPTPPPATAAAVGEGVIGGGSAVVETRDTGEAPPPQRAVPARDAKPPASPLPTAALSPVALPPPALAVQPPPVSEAHVPSLSLGSEGTTVSGASGNGRPAAAPAAPPRGIRALPAWLVFSGAWTAVFVYLAFFEAVATAAADWVICTTPADKTRVLACTTYTKDVPLSAAMPSFIAAAAISGVVHVMWAVTAGTLLTLTPLVVEIIVLLTPPATKESRISVARLGAIYILLAFVLVATGVLRVVSQRRQFALMLSADEAFHEYHEGVTRWHTTQRQLLMSREAASKAQAARAVQEASMGYLSHQLLNPLHGLINTLDYLSELTDTSESGAAAAAAQGQPPPPFPRRYALEGLDDMTAAAAQMDRVLADVAAHQALLSGSVTLQRQPVDARALVRNLAIAFQAEYERPVIPVVADRSLPRLLLLDPVRLAQALSYGLANAIAATPHGSPLSVHMLRVLAPAPSHGAALELSPAALYSDAVRQVLVLDSRRAYLTAVQPGGASLPGAAGADGTLAPQRRRHRGSVPSHTGSRETALVRVSSPQGTPEAVGAGAADPQQWVVWSVSEERLALALGERRRVGRHREAQGRPPLTAGGGNGLFGLETVAPYLHVEVRNVGRGLSGLDVEALFSPFTPTGRRRSRSPRSGRRSGLASDGEDGSSVGGGAATLTALRSTGLGLPIALLLAVLMRGRVGLYDVYATPRRGAAAAEGGGTDGAGMAPAGGVAGSIGPAPAPPAARGSRRRERLVYAYTVFMIQVPLLVPHGAMATAG